MIGSVVHTSILNKTEFKFIYNPGRFGASFVIMPVKREFVMVFDIFSRRAAKVAGCFNQWGD